MWPSLLEIRNSPGWAVLLVIVLVPAFARGQRLPLKAYTVADGLAHNEINKIVRDSRGFLWFCTAEGLSRFDGYAFANYGTAQGLPHPYVNDLLETRAGEYWIATNGGLVHFTPKGAPTSYVTYAAESLAANPMFTVVVPDEDDRRARAINVIIEDHNGTIWCGSYKGLFRLDRVNNRLVLQRVDIGIPNEYPEQQLISDLLEDGYGSLWIGTPNGLYRRWPDGSAARYTEKDGLPDSYLHDLFIDHQGQLWVGTRGSGFFRIVADETRKPPIVARTYTVRDGLPAKWVFRLFEGSDHRFWIATSDGVAQFFPNGDGPSGKLFRVYKEQNGLLYHDISALNEDLGGNLWLGSYAGAMKLARDGFVTYDVQDGVFMVNAIFGDLAGGVCFRGYVLGVDARSVFEGARIDVTHPAQEHLPRFGRFDGQSFNWFLPRGLKRSEFGWVDEGLTLQTHTGEWWVGTGAGVYRFGATMNFAQLSAADPIAVYRLKDQQNARQILRLFEDSRGDIWISALGETNALAIWDHGSDKVRDLTDSPGLPSLKDDVARSFGEDRWGSVWVGFNSGVARYRGGGFQFFTAKDGVPLGGVQYIYSDSAGRIWLASARSGLLRVDDPAADKPYFKTYTTADGLSSNSVAVITDDARGRVYVGTGRGLDTLDPDIGRIKHFTTADGLVSGSFLSAFRDSNGGLWFGTQKGLSRFTPAPEQRVDPAPVLITGLQVAGVRRLLSALGDDKVSLPALAANQNQLQIDFVGLGFASGEVLRYQYKLEGADADWSAPSEQRAVNYANLAPRTYRFLVRAVNSDGVVSASPAIVSFTILRPIWQRWWFVALGVFAGTILVYALYRYRVTRLLAVERVRARIAADLHDDIGSNLTKISILSEVARQEATNGDARKDSPLAAIARISRESVAAMGDIVWAINPQRDSLRDVIRRMRLHAEETCLPNNVDLTFTAPEEGHLKLGIETRRSLYLIFKEAVNNAARHSACSRMRVELSLDKHSLILEISDNGRGFDLALDSEGNGFLNMERRAKSMNGTLEINSTIKKGTSVRLSLPCERSSFFLPT